MLKTQVFGLFVQEVRAEIAGIANSVDGVPVSFWGEIAAFGPIASKLETEMVQRLGKIVTLQIF